MRRIVFVTVCLIAGIVGCYSQQNRAGWTAIVGTKWNGNSSADVWGVEAGGGYQKFLFKNLFLNPQGLVYLNRWDDGVKKTFLGVNLRTDFGYRLPTAIGFEVFTGPDFDVNFKRATMSHEYPGKDYVSGDNEEGSYPYTPVAVLRWRLGVGVNLGAFSIKGAYALGVSHGIKNSSRQLNLFEVSLGYRLGR